MDLSKFKTSDWLKVGGGALMFVAGFLTWWQPDCRGNEECEAFIDSVGLDYTGLDLTFTGLIPWLLLLAIAVLTFLSAAAIFNLPASLPTPLLFLAASGYSVIMVVIRLFADPFDSVWEIGDETSRGIGLYLALIAAIAVLIGCVQGFTEAGGNLADLKDPNKIKASFGAGQGGQSAPPPPPPGAGTPPPPPPPPPVG